jgi:hypothetical protein
MATTIEKQFGRAALVETLKDPRAFVLKYNQAATIRARSGVKLTMFSPEIFAAVGMKAEAGGAGEPQ